MQVRKIATIQFLLIASGLLLFSFASQSDPVKPDQDFLAELGVKVTSGAAPGYIEDRACGFCHAELYASYQEVGMARSFFKPTPDKLIEDLDQSYFHKPSGNHYQLFRRGDALFFKRHQLDEKGQPINVYERKIDWIMGSGYHTRVYIYQTPAGELYQLPLGWYTATQSWGMSPGFDRPDHEGVLRRVRRECMFCHNAYPDVPEGSDFYGQAQHYPKQLPEGTGCQRCHGPGEQHARQAFAAEPDQQKLRDAIVNPGKLEPQRRDDVCFECHMLPSVAIPGIRLFGRGDYSFRPGQDLADYRLVLDIEEEGKTKDQRFEINHHPYRLRQSKCYIESKDALSCLTCHDPHVKVREPERAAHFRKACLSCHGGTDCGLEPARGTGQLPAHLAEVDAGDCVTCHMPKRRTQDVVQVVMTDHTIRRKPGGAELLAPIKESEPIITGLSYLEPHRAPTGEMADLYRVMAVLRAGGGPELLDHLAGMLEKIRPQTLEPYIELASGYIKRKRFADAEKVLNFILKEQPKHQWARERLAVAVVAQGRSEAIAMLEKVLLEFPESPEPLYNLGRIKLALGLHQEAKDLLTRATAARPNQVLAWYFLGETFVRLEDHNAAVDAFRVALQLDPTLDRAYLAMGKVLLAMNQRQQAVRYWRHGLSQARRPEAIAKELQKIGAN